MDPLDPQFDDPAMKAALRRVIGGATAPPMLRQRILKSMTVERRLVDAHARPAPRTVLRAMAAVLLIGLVLMRIYVSRSRDEQVPQWVATAIVATHDQCAALPNHHLLEENVNDADFAALGKLLPEKLTQAVVLGSPGPDWKFQGAGICKINGVGNGSHLVFTRGDETISIISCSASPLYQRHPEDGSSYAQVEADHPMAGFVYHGAIHCVVASSKSGKVTLAQVIKIRDQLRATVM